MTTPSGFGGKPTQLLSPCSLRWQLQRDQDVENNHEIKGLQTLEPTLHSSADQPELLTWTTKPRSSLSMMSSYKPSVKQRMPSQRSNVSPYCPSTCLYFLMLVAVAVAWICSSAKSMLSCRFCSPNMSSWIVLLYKVYWHSAKCQLRFLEMVLRNFHTQTKSASLRKHSHY